jgi:hypothetical protein
MIVRTGAHDCFLNLSEQYLPRLWNITLGGMWGGAGWGETGSQCVGGKSIIISAEAVIIIRQPALQNSCPQ